MDKVIFRENRSSQSTRKSGVEMPKFFSSWVVQITFVAIACILFYSVYKSINITSQKLNILNQAEKEVEELRLKNLYLSVEMKDMETDQYLEKEARNRLNFGADGEVVFVLPQGAMQAAKEEVNKILSGGSDPSTPSDSLAVWTDFVLSGI